MTTRSAASDKSVVRIGGASAFWGDSVTGPIQLVERAEVDYLVFDYLAETTMALLAAARSRNPERGYATDFIDAAMEAVLPTLAAKRIKVIANAGGLNPQGCAAALEALCNKAGLVLKIAVVLGDDVLARLSNIDTFTMDGRPMRVSQTLTSANAYLGAIPIARALEEGADIVITGRCVDSALTLGALMYEFGWSANDYDRLAAGSLAGHIIECGCQATGGLYTDWERVSDWADIGYPVIQCSPDGRFIVSKAPGTGGLISAAAVAEQMLYEIGDPTAYLLPDVVCDFSQVRIEQQGPDRVSVTGARGKPPTDCYKVSTTYMDGYRSAGSVIIIGIDAVAKAQRTGEAILQRSRSLFGRRAFPDFTATRIEVIGAESSYGPHARVDSSREVMMRVAVTHPSKAALELFSREIAPAATSWAPGTTMPAGGRPNVSPVIRQLACTVRKCDVPVSMVMDSQTLQIPVPLESGRQQEALQAAPQYPDGPKQGTGSTTVPLIVLAHARSGDKGDQVNIGVIARKPEYLPLLLAQLTPAAVGAYFSHLVRGPVSRFDLPGIHAINFVLDNALDGGGPSSLRMDPLGKGMAQMLLDFRIVVTSQIAATASER